MKKGSRKEEDMLLGDFILPSVRFENLDALFQEFKTEEFRILTDRQKLDLVSRILYEQILGASAGFILIALIDFIDRIHREKVLESYSLATFELWFNQREANAKEENLALRGKIMGKWVPRDEYQILFPVGMGKTFSGSHFVTAHGSPDLDTTVASFWGWVDAFAARVSDGLHLWNVPGGAPLSQVEVRLLFCQIFGEGIFSHASRSRTTLAALGVDLMTQRGMVRKRTDESSLSMDLERNSQAVVLVDEQGYFLGDFRALDVEGVRQIIMLLNQCLRWYESKLHVELISLFSRESLTVQNVQHFAKLAFGIRLMDCEPAKEFSEQQKRYVEDYLCKVLMAPNGLESTIEEFAVAMQGLLLLDFQQFIDLVKALQYSSLFDASGRLIESRPMIFKELEKIILGLNQAIYSVRTYVERLDVALKVKSLVFGYQPQAVSYRAEVEEIRSKIGSYPYLTVTAPDQGGRLIPLGVIHASDLHKPILGSVSLRDFSNREETKIPSYLEVISIIDHHKSALQTTGATVAVISDAQSSNTLVAELAFVINDRYSTGAMSLDAIEKQKKEMGSSSAPERRILQRLLQRELAFGAKGEHYVNKEREFVEYMHFLYAIFDDTDLLSKISWRDVECVSSLLNRMKSLMLGREVEILAFDDLSRSDCSLKLAAKRILQHPDTYSLYRKIYLAKEEAMSENLRLCAAAKPSTIFIDTKEQNGCCRIGQTKIFSRNFGFFDAHADAIRSIWYEEAHLFYKERSEVDLHLHMISTISGAEDLYQGGGKLHSHKDEIWIWVPMTEQAIVHLKSFLNAFKNLPQFATNEVEVEFMGDSAKELDQIFTESFLPVPRKVSDQKLPIAVLRFKAGTINSRKAMISPYLPKLVT